MDLQVEVSVDLATGAWTGHVGVVTELIPGARFDHFLDLRIDR